MSPRTRFSSLLAALAVSTLGLAACGEIDDPSADPVAGADAGADAALPPAAGGHSGDDHASHDHRDHGHGLVSTQSQALYGAAAFDGCGPLHRAALEAGMAYAQARANTPEYRACLMDAFGVEADGRMVEELIADTTTMRGVTFTCREPGPNENPGAFAGSDHHGNESMRWLGDYLLTLDAAQIAGVIVHEISHNHDWTHYHGYGPTWPDQVQSCIGGDEPFGTRRSQLAEARLLPPVGGEGGSYRRLQCGDEEAMVGIQGAIDGAGKLVRLQPMCQRTEGDRRVAHPYSFAMSLPNGAQMFQDVCGANRAVVGLYGNADRYVRRVRALCSDIGDLRAMTGHISDQWMPLRGQNQDQWYARRCPERTVATGMRVRTGALVDGFQLECDDFPLQERSVGLSLSGHGGHGGTYSQAECPGTYGLVGLYAHRNVDNGKLTDIGGRCRQMTDDGVLRGQRWGWSLAATERVGRTQPTEAAENRLFAECPDGQALVGLSISANHIVGDVSPLCADLDDWMIGVRRYNQLNGISWQPGETIEQVVCPVRQVAVSLEVRSGWYVDRIDLRCKAPDVAGKLRDRAPVGGNGGTVYDEICPDMRPMVGLRTRTFGGELRWLNGRCGRHTDDGTSTVGHIDASGVRSNANASAIDVCPLGSVMIGAQSVVSGNLVRRVRAVCANEDSVRQGGAPAGITRTAWRGGNYSTANAQETLCGWGEVVRGFRGRRGELQDQLGLVCGKVPGLPGAAATGSVLSGQPELHVLTIPEGFDGDLRLRLSGLRWLQPTVRLRRGAVPTAPHHDAEVQGVNGVAWLNIDDVRPGRYYVEVSAHAGIGGSYTLHYEAL